MANRYIEVMKILTSESQELKELAKFAGKSRIDFYQGADLRSLDLRGQDLRGLNFEKADLRGADLSDVIFDEGAFNGSKMDEEDDYLQDDYEFYVGDLDVKEFEFLFVFFKIRPELIEEFISATDMSYQSFAKNVGISAGTLVRVRKGEPVSYETLRNVVKIFPRIIQDWAVRGIFLRVREKISQPSIEVGTYNKDGNWVSLDRSRITEVFRKMDFVLESRYGPEWRERSGADIWRSRPSTIEWAFGFYRKYPNHIWRLTDEIIKQLEVMGEADSQSVALNGMPLFEQ